jgi:ParB/RepB/Spo0J family partition protein
MIQASPENIRLALIDPPAQPSRDAIDPERVGALADDIAANGLLQPIGITGPGPDGRYRVAYGHRRLLALRLLQWTDVPALVWPHDTDPAQLRISENNIREQLTPLEEAADVKRMLDRGHPLSAVARFYRRSVAWVNGRRELLDLPPDVREALADQKLGLDVARIIGDVDHEPYRRSLIAEAARTGATANVVTVWRAHYIADRERIIENHMMVAEIAERREAWKIVIDCELCGEPKEYPQTRSLRACIPCLEEVDKLIQEHIARALAAPLADHSTPGE